MHGRDYLKCKKRLGISSLNAAICNVAVFKSMKERQFRDEIFISYSEEGVMLEAKNAEEWERANTYVENFLNSKKIGLMAFGHDKEVYEDLINKGLKDYTRRMKEQNEDCPYINIIHYQKLRKSCEYMDKERYVEPLKDWERKNKKNPNFAFLMVEPVSRFEEVKKKMLEWIMKRELWLEIDDMSPLYFLLLFFSSSVKEELRESFEKTMVELSVIGGDKLEDEQGEPVQHKIKMVNYTETITDDLDYAVIRHSKNIGRLGLEFIPAQQIQEQIKKVKLFLPPAVALDKENVSTVGIFDKMHSDLVKKHGQNYVVIPFKHSQREKYSAMIQKFVRASQVRSSRELMDSVNKFVLCDYEDIEFLGEIESGEERGYRIWKCCIDDCPYMLHEYKHISMNEIDTFLLYIEQLHTYQCSYLVRFYGLAIKYGPSSQGIIPADMSPEQKLEGYTYYLIFDYHHRSLDHMVAHDMILDNFQVAQMVLQIIYLISFLQTHPEPRALGHVRLDEVYWPLRIVLPYLSDDKESPVEGGGKTMDTHDEGFEGDVRLAGMVMKTLLETNSDSKAEETDDHFQDILVQMLKTSKYDRISLSKCMNTMEELLQLN